MAHDVKYHVHLSQEMLEDARVAILPGDPGRVEKTAQFLDPDARFLASNREFTSWLATLDGRKVLVCSTGIGGPSVSICVEELAALGVTCFIRIGTTGAIQADIDLPCVIVTTGAVRLDGASTHYAPIEYPAVADLELTNALVAAVKELGLNHRVGITAACDTFYPGQERYDTFSGYVPRRFQGSLDEWQHLKVLNYEMESATLFVIASVFGLKAAMVASAIVSRARAETPDDAVLVEAELNLARVVKRALQIHIAQPS
ncbi:MAG: uridine phosphorylase [Thermoanaerobaculaceae bacterium]|jgi:uridine phosphorylase|nr:uridine phosphorylase [Thermoanaerobaculaceae bacterium]